MGDMIYRPLIEGMRWSYSRAHGFNQCKYAWFLKYIHKSEKQERFYTSYGTFMHRLIEWFHRGLFTASELLNIFISDFSSSVKGERPNDGIVRKYIKAGIEYLKTLKPYPFKVVAVEEKIDFEIGGIQMTAVVDVLGQDDDGEYIIIDNKSRDLKPRSNREKPTMNDTIYMLALVLMKPWFIHTPHSLSRPESLWKFQKATSEEFMQGAASPQRKDCALEIVLVLSTVTTGEKSRFRYTTTRI